MIKQQFVYFDNNLNFNVQTGGIINNGTEILNLFFRDNCNVNSLTLIDSTLEWKPQIWIEFEKEKLKKLKEINVICLMGNLENFFLFLKRLFPDIQINYYNYHAYDAVYCIKDTLSRKKYLPKEQIRKNTVYLSIGTMRLNRYILVKEFYCKDYELYYPSISHENSKDYEYQIGKCLNEEIQQSFSLKEKRLFEKNISVKQFNIKQIIKLSEAYINIVATFPNTDLLKDGEDEKYFDCLLCKTVPFLLHEKNSNISGVETLGFLPYTGFDLKNDNNNNPIERWKFLLKDNEYIFRNLDKAKEIYDKNLEIIEHNFNKLTNTDWEQELLIQYKKLPEFIKNFLDNK
jgi:hypothetical protein